MGCPSCGTENPAAAKSCQECGASLPRCCPACGQPVSLTAKFCQECGKRLGSGPPEAGTPLSSSPRPSAPEAAPSRYTPRHLAEKILAGRDALQGERKQITVLFADVVGSTELIRDLDAEEAQRLLDGVVQRMMAAVHRYEGTVSRLQGDGLMAMFGAPVAHEDHAVRACYAALAMLDDCRVYADEVRQSYGANVQVRVGLNSGEVIVRLISDDLHMDYTAMGPTVHLASRMESLAQAGTALLPASTMSLATGFIEARALGSMPVKGLDQPVEVFELVGTGAARTRLQASAARGLTRFVGRARELELVLAAAHRAGDGQGRLVALVGEPGAGKSRLVHEIVQATELGGWSLMQGGALSYGASTAYLPIVDLLRAYFRIEQADDAETIRNRVTAQVLGLDAALGAIIAPLLALLDVPVQDPVWGEMDPPRRRRATLDAVKRLLLRESQCQPLLLIVEDLHWIDSESQALLDELVDVLPTARMLLLVNFRPEYSHEWGNKSAYTQVRIDPLETDGAEALLRSLLGDGPDLAPLKRHLSQRTGGNPLFLEESVRDLAETGALIGKVGHYTLARNLDQVRVPATIQAILASRIDRLDPETKRLLQTAAVVGKDVPLVLLQAVSDVPAEALVRLLAQLQAAELLYPTQLFPDPEYTFKHALTHDVASNGLLQERRKALHASIVRAIERLHSDRLDEHVERLAHHAMRAEAWEHAARYCQLAGAKAIGRSAFREAVGALEDATVALAHLPDERELVERAIDARLDLRSVLFPLGQFDRMRGTLREAERLAEEIGDRHRLARVLIALSGYLSNAGDPAECVRVAQQAGAIGLELDDLGIRVTAAYGAALGQFFHGEYPAAVASSRWVVSALPDELRFERFGQMGLPSVTTGARLVDCLGEMGHFEEAFAAARVAVETSEALRHPFSQVAILSSLGLTHALHGDVQAAIAALERALDRCRTWEIVAYVWNVSARLGYAYALVGRTDEGLTLLEQSAVRAESVAHAAEFTPMLIWMGEAHLLAGHPEQAQAVAERGLQLAMREQQRGRQAYAGRVLAEIASRREPMDGAHGERSYREALILAEQLEMRPLQAHCHVGLGKLFRRVGRQDEAHAELTVAASMLREMGMVFWLPEAEQELAAALSGR